MFVRGLCFELFCSNYSHTLLLRDLTLSRSLSLSHLFSTGSVPLPLTLSPPPSERERVCALSSARACALALLPVLGWQPLLHSHLPPPPPPPLSLVCLFCGFNFLTDLYSFLPLEPLRISQVLSLVSFACAHPCPFSIGQTNVTFPTNQR